MPGWLHLTLQLLPAVALFWAIGYAVFIRRRGLTVRWSVIGLHLVATTAAAAFIRDSMPPDLEGYPVLAGIVILASVRAAKWSAKARA